MLTQLALALVPALAQAPAAPAQAAPIAGIQAALPGNIVDVAASNGNSTTLVTAL
jgi:hypothetical protein